MLQAKTKKNSEALQEVLTITCPACAEARGHDRLFIVNQCAIIKCQKCGLGRTTEASFDPKAYYTASYFNGSHGDGYADYEGSGPILRKEFRGIVEDLARLIPMGGHVLEIGCAYGFFLQEARARYKVTGIEIAESAAVACREAGLDVYHGVVTLDLLQKIGTVDAIVLLDVIEHLSDPEHDLRLLAEYLRPGGVIILSTGDFSSALAKRMGPRWRLMTPPQHLWYFTPKSLRGIATRLGLSFESLSHPWKFVPFNLIVFQLKRILGLRSVGTGTSLFRSLGIPVNLFDAMRVVLRKPNV